MVDQFLDSILDEEDPGRLERLDKTAREAYRHTVPDPRIAIAPYPHFDIQGLAVIGSTS
jgi:hypothetical protein